MVSHAGKWHWHGAAEIKLLRNIEFPLAAIVRSWPTAAIREHIQKPIQPDRPQPTQTRHDGCSKAARQPAKRRGPMCTVVCMLYCTKQEMICIFVCPLLKTTLSHSVSVSALTPANCAISIGLPSPIICVGARDAFACTSATIDG